MSNQHYFDVPFAFSGDVTAIPDSLQTGGTVSFTEGWNYNYQRDLTTDPAALPIDRSTMNWLLLQITTAIQALQKETIPEFITAAQNGGTAIAYNPQAVVLWSASGSAPFTKFVNILTGTNSNTPSASDVLGTTTGWQVVCDPIATSAQASAGTNNASVMTPLLVAQQTALRALLAGNSSQVFNVAPATASTHAVQLAQLQAAYRGYKLLASYSASQTLTASGSNPCQGGATFFSGSTASQTLTLPAYSTMTSNATSLFKNIASVAVTLACQGSDTINANGSSVTSIVLQPGDDLELVNGSSNYYATFGSTLRQFSPLTVAAATGANHATRLVQVQNYRGTLQGVGGANASTTYTAAQVVGSVLVYYGTTAAQTLTLPTRASVVAIAPNACTSFINRSSVPVTVAAASGDTFAISPNNVSLTSIVLQPGDDLELVTDGSSALWNVIGGSSARQYAPLVVATATATTQASPVAQQTGRLLNVQRITATGTYTPTPGTTKIIVEACAGGGSGGGALSTAASVGGGGSGGAFGRILITAVPASVSCTIGAGAVGNSGAGGGSGGNTVFGSYLTVGGGNGGAINSGTSFPIFAVPGAQPTTVTVAGATTLDSGTGGSGGWGIVASAGGTAESGAGGSSGNGLGGGVIQGTGNAGAAGRANSGAGGSGACNNNSGGSAQAGGAGGSGYINVYEYGTAVTVA